MPFPPSVDIPSVLGAAPLFAGIDPESRARLAADCRSRRYRRGQVVFFEGDPSDAVLVVAAGRLKVVSTSPDGDQLLLQVVDPGESVGEVGVLDGEPRSATVEAIEDAAVVVVPAEALWACIERSPTAARGLLRSLGATLRRLTGDTADLVFLDLPRRVAKLLLSEYEETGAERVAVGLNQTDLGQRIGGSRQSVNTALRSFARRGWVGLDGGEIVVRDPDALRRFLQY